MSCLSPADVEVAPIDNSLGRRAGGLSHIEKAHIEELAQAQAIKRPGSSKDIVGTVLFLAGDSSAWVTGQTIMADAGLVRL